MHTHPPRPRTAPDSLLAWTAPAAWALLAALSVCLTTGCGAIGPEANRPAAVSSGAYVETEDGGEVALVLDGRNVTVAELDAHMQK